MKPIHRWPGPPRPPRGMELAIPSIVSRAFDLLFERPLKRENLVTTARWFAEFAHSLRAWNDDFIACLREHPSFCPYSKPAADSEYAAKLARYKDDIVSGFLSGNLCAKLHFLEANLRRDFGWLTRKDFDTLDSIVHGFCQGPSRFIQGADEFVQKLDTDDSAVISISEYIVACRKFEAEVTVKANDYGIRFLTFEEYDSAQKASGPTFIDQSITQIVTNSTIQANAVGHHAEASARGTARSEATQYDWLLDVSLAAKLTANHRLRHKFADFWAKCRMVQIDVGTIDNVISLVSAALTESGIDAELCRRGSHPELLELETEHLRALPFAGPIMARIFCVGSKRQLGWIADLAAATELDSAIHSRFPDFLHSSARLEIDTITRDAALAELRGFLARAGFSSRLCARGIDPFVPRESVQRLRTGEFSGELMREIFGETPILNDDPFLNDVMVSRLVLQLTEDELVAISPRLLQMAVQFLDALSDSSMAQLNQVGTILKIMNATWARVVAASGSATAIGEVRLVLPVRCSFWEVLRKGAATGGLVDLK
jgi:hypothetical protein